MPIDHHCSLNIGFNKIFRFAAGLIFPDCERFRCFCKHYIIFFAHISVPTTILFHGIIKWLVYIHINRKFIFHRVIFL